MGFGCRFGSSPGTQARNLSTEDSLPCDPFVVVECCGKRYQTDTKEAKAMRHDGKRFNSYS